MPFTPWGFNYDRDHKMRLLEDYWVREWNQVVEDFQEMHRLGANTVRVHLQFARFMESPTEPNPVALGQLKRLLRLAEANRLYLDLTGLACYRKSDAPQWYTRMSEAERWACQERFWEAIAATCAKSPAVFCYDLMNEPLVPAEKRAQGDWLTGELLGFNYCQFITLDPAGRERSQVAREWVARLAAAVRRQAPGHLVTVGFLPNSLAKPVSESGFDPWVAGLPLDFICVHLYPASGRLKQDLELLKGFNVGKPVVIEETFPLSCQPGELKEFIQASKGDAAGWFGFYWGQTPEELERLSGIGEKLTLQWLRLFEELNPNRN